MTPDLPTAETWFRRQEVEPGVTRLLEPHVDGLVRANMWHVRGRDHDLLIDGGMGVVPLRPAFPDLFDARPVLAVASHTHVDHIGALHEFAERAVHPIEAAELADPTPASLVSADLDPALRAMFVAAGFPRLNEYLIEALPHPWYDVGAYRLRPAPATRLLREGDVVDPGGRAFRVLWLPGHSPGGIALWDATDGTLFAGDVIYDGPLLYEGEGMDVAAYAASFRRLRDLPVRIVHAGHNESFGGERMRAIIDEYLTRWGAA
jgi:glyoxylase-like metal-dependent hydrolase (beta-lactamase superfamily II)